jgi:hypothetical protein
MFIASRLAGHLTTLKAMHFGPPALTRKCAVTISAALALRGIDC